MSDPADCRREKVGTKRLVVRMYGRRGGDHVHVRVFSGLVPTEASGAVLTLACAGTLTFRAEEWGRLRALVLRPSVIGPAHVTIPFDAPPVVPDDVSIYEEVTFDPEGPRT